MDLGLGYLTLDRAASTLSTGERQRMQLARAVRNRTTGVLYVLDEPSIGLHPSNIIGLTGVMHDLIADGNSVVLVDHDTQILSEADWIIEMGPGAGSDGGRVIAQGPIAALAENSESKIGPFLTGKSRAGLCSQRSAGELFSAGKAAPFHRRNPHCKTVGGRYSKGQGIDGCDGRIRLRQDHFDFGKPDSRP